MGQKLKKYSGWDTFVHDNQKGYNHPLRGF